MVMINTASTPAATGAGCQQGDHTKDCQQYDIIFHSTLLV
jgi:hypothetical protein